MLNYSPPNNKLCMKYTSFISIPHFPTPLTCPPACRVASIPLPTALFHHSGKRVQPQKPTNSFVLGIIVSPEQKKKIINGNNETMKRLLLLR